MHKAITPEPHFIPGYCGHCPRYMYRAGGTYGHLTHDTLLSPCAGHAKELILMPLKAEAQMASPTDNELKTLKFREGFVDTVYRDPIIPGYDGFVPRMAAQVGKRFLAAATSGITEHEAEMELLRCENRHLVHSGLLDSDRGLFTPKMGERMIPRTVYPSPLVPVKPHCSVTATEDCNIKPKKEPYTKNTVPHFLENEDDHKWIVSGYCGHIPMAKMRHGQSNKELSHSALTDFSNYIRTRRLDAWCNLDKAQGVGNSTCPSNIDYTIYDDDTGFIPKYAGHVPGHLYKVGLRYTLSTSKAKEWLRDHRNQDNYEY